MAGLGETSQAVCLAMELALKLLNKRLMLLGWQVVDRAEAAKAAQEKGPAQDTKPAKSRVKKKRSHDDKLG